MQSIDYDDVLVNVAAVGVDDAAVAMDHLNSNNDYDRLLMKSMMRRNRGYCA